MIEKKQSTHHDEDWQGYTLDDLRYQRAVAMARIEIEKEKLKMSLGDMRTAMPGAGAHGIVGKIMGSLSYIDYVVLAFRLTRTLSKAFRGLRRK